MTEKEVLLRNIGSASLMVCELLFVLSKGFDRPLKYYSPKIQSRNLTQSGCMKH